MEEALPPLTPTAVDLALDTCQGEGGAGKAVRW